MSGSFNLGEGGGSRPASPEPTRPRPAAAPAASPAKTWVYVLLAVAVIALGASWYFFYGPGSYAGTPSVASPNLPPELEAARQAEGEKNLGTAGGAPQDPGADAPRPSNLPPPPQDSGASLGTPQ